MRCITDYCRSNWRPRQPTLNCWTPPTAGPRQHCTPPPLRAVLRAERGWRAVTDPVEAKGLEPSNLLTASQALYQLSYAPDNEDPSRRPVAVCGRVGSCSLHSSSRPSPRRSASRHRARRRRRPCLGSPVPQRTPQSAQQHPSPAGLQPDRDSRLSPQQRSPRQSSVEPAPSPSPDKQVSPPRHGPAARHLFSRVGTPERRFKASRAHLVTFPPPRRAAPLLAEAVCARRYLFWHPRMTGSSLA